MENLIKINLVFFFFLRYISVMDIRFHLILVCLSDPVFFRQYVTTWVLFYQAEGCPSCKF